MVLRSQRRKEREIQTKTLRNAHSTQRHGGTEARRHGGTEAQREELNYSDFYKIAIKLYWA
jgi:hypothetical protein